MQAAPRVSSRLASKQRISWRGGVPNHERPLASAADAQPAQLADELEQAAALLAQFTLRCSMKCVCDSEAY